MKKNKSMGKSRYKICEPIYPPFIICTILHWLPLFINKESVQIIIDSLIHLQKSNNFTIFSYVILENHLHLMAQSDGIGKSTQNRKYLPDVGRRFSSKTDTV